MRCRYCRAVGLEVLACCWPEYQMQLARYGELKEGDRVTRFVNRSAKPPARVLSIDNAGDLLQITLQIGTRKRIIIIKPTSPVRVERMDVCGWGCCELHSVDRGSKVYCMEHWKAWEDVA